MNAPLQLCIRIIPLAEIVKSIYLEEKLQKQTYRESVLKHFLSIVFRSKLLGHSFRFAT